MNDTAVLLIRVSSDDQARGFSPASQERLLKEAAATYNVLKTFRLTESAKTSETRRLFKEAIAFIIENKVGHLFVWSQERIARHYKDFATVQSLIDDYDVCIDIVEQNKPISQKSPIADRFMFQVMAAMAEAENRKRAADTRRGMDQKARQGGVPHLAPVGYLNTIDPTDTNTDPTRRRRIVVKDKDRAPLITWAFEAFGKGGWSLQTMAAELNRRGLTMKPSPRRPARPITQGMLHKMLTNKFYTGKFTSGGQEHLGTYEPLITPELFEQVRARLTGNRTYSRPASRKWFCFRPFTKCGHCPSTITAYEKAGRHGRGHYVYYECTSGKKKKDPQYYFRKFGTENCIQRRWKEEEIDALIEGAIGRLYINDFIASKIRTGLKKSNTEEELFEKKERRRLETEVTRRTNHLKLCYQDRLDGHLSIDQYNEVSAEVQADLTRAQAEIAKLNQHNIEYREQGSQVLELLHGVKDVYSKANQHGKRKFLEVMVDRIVLQDDPVVVWQEPFATLFTIGEVFRERSKWGE